MALVIKVEIDGARELDKKFAMFQALLKAGLLDAWQEVANSLHAKIKARVPKQSMALMMSTTPKVMPWHVQSIASAIDERTGFNYAKIQHDGGMGAWERFGPRSRKTFHISGKNYMVGPLYATAPEVPGILDREIAKIIAQCGL